MSAKDEIDNKLSTPGGDDFNNRAPPKRLSSRIADLGEAPKTNKKSGGCFSYCGCSVEAVTQEADVVLIGGGIMSATMGTMLKELEPTWRICLYERLGTCGEESSNGWNNAGTGHSALCELNYTKEKPDGTIDASKAFSVCKQFQLSRQFWAYLCDAGLISNKWIQSVAHMSFVVGEKNCTFLKKRHELLVQNSLFKGMEYSEDAKKIAEWAPLLMKERNLQKKFACTYMPKGTDVDFGTLTKEMVHAFSLRGGAVFLYHTVTDIKKDTTDDHWVCTVSKDSMGQGKFKIKAKEFVFAGAGGWAILMLQKANIPAVYGYAGGPVSGQFLVCQKPEIVDQHRAKVYTKGEIGAPPMSEPHLDARIIEGKPLLLFGPYAGINTRFLKFGNLTDAFKMIKYHNLIPLTCAALQNFDLVIYLLGMLAATKSSRMADLHQIMPSANPDDWTLITAGMRVQVIKKDPSTGKYIFQFGTEVVWGPKKNICGLLGASPGASTAVQVCFDIIQKASDEGSGAFKGKLVTWTPKLKSMVPSFGIKLDEDQKLADKLFVDTAKSLDITN